MCPLYVAGLIGPGERKSIQPMAERLGLPSHDALHHFIAAGAWDAGPLEAALLREADRLVGGRGAFLIVDDTALPKKGMCSVGVAPQFASALGKTANCQTLVSLTLARGEVPVPIALRLFLPEEWTGDAARLEKAGVPGDRRAPRSKPEMALAEIDRAVATGVRFGPVLADAGYGTSAAFRAGLSERGLRWAVGIPRILKSLSGQCRRGDSPWRQSPQAERAGSTLALRRSGPGRGDVAAGDLAARHEGAALGPVRRRPDPGCRRPGAADRRQARAAPSRRDGLGRGRASGVRRDEVLPLQPARRHGSQDLRGHHQGARACEQVTNN
ncbi:IS701 family transposase [Muricoccus radiodurans]|uniref:IS701 family transposase n=1 Tax=Muricoccus radiodurans TaxID=2231721 RepID=UPI003CF8F87C